MLTLRYLTLPLSTSMAPRAGLGGSPGNPPGGNAEVAALSASGTTDAGSVSPPNAQDDAAAWQPAAPVRSSRTTVDDEVPDRPSTAGPGALRRYSGYVAAALAVVALGWMLRRAGR